MLTNSKTSEKMIFSFYRIKFVTNENLDYTFSDLGCQLLDILQIIRLNSQNIYCIRKCIAC